MYRNYLLHSLLSLLFIIIISHTFSEATVLRHSVSRAFAPELIKGHYSKSATYPGTSGDQCPKSFKFEGHDATARGSSVVHRRIVVDGVKCTSEGEVNFLKLDAAIEIPHVMPALREKDIARLAAVALLKNSESFLGVAKTDMHCGKNIIPKGAAYAFVFEKKDVPLANGQLVLKKNLKHVLIFYKRAETVIGCVYDNGSNTNVHGQNPSPAKPPAKTGGPVAEEPSPDPTTTGSSTYPVTGSAKGNTEEKKAEPSPGPRECFSADSTVELITGEKRRMADVKIGDVVRVGAETFSEIFMTTHNDPKTYTTFLKIRAGDKQIVLTPGHFLYVNGQLRPARFVRINDKLYNAENQPLKVHEISRVQRKGLFNPQTLHGDIIVDGIRTSTYTTAIMPSAAHALLAPLRAFQVGIRGVPITETVA